MQTNGKPRNEQRIGVTLSDLPWWTPADQAELDRIGWEIVDLSSRHQAECWDCSPTMGCQAWRRMVGDAIDAAVEFRRGRELASRAEYLRSLDEPVPHRPTLRAVA